LFILSLPGFAQGGCLLYASFDLRNIDSLRRIIMKNDVFDRIYKNLSQAQIYTFHNAGHVPAITHETEYIEVLRNFLKQ
jgi:pimeloyl-ACP methyl ester carboxylesterase